MAKRIIVIVLVAAVLFAVVNDLWRYLEAQRTLRDTTYTISRWAAENAPAMSRDRVATAIAEMAAPSGVRVTMYGQTDSGVQVWTQTEVPGTIIFGTVANLLAGKSVAEAPSAPFLIEDYRTAGIK